MVEDRRLDCGCPAQAAYTITRGTHTPLRICHHHGDKLKAAAIRQGFIVTEVKVEAPA